MVNLGPRDLVVSVDIDQVEEGGQVFTGEETIANILKDVEFRSGDQVVLVGIEDEEEGLDFFNELSLDGRSGGSIGKRHGKGRELIGNCSAVLN